MPTLPIATDWTQNPPLAGTTHAINAGTDPVDNPPAPDATDLDNQDPKDAGSDPKPTTWTPAPTPSDAAMSRTIRKPPRGYYGRWLRRPACRNKYRQVDRCMSQELTDSMTASALAQLKVARCGRSYQPNSYDGLYISSRVREAQLPAKCKLPKLHGVLKARTVLCKRSRFARAVLPDAETYVSRKELVAIELLTNWPDELQVPEQSPLYGKLYRAASGHWTVEHRQSTRHWNTKLLPRGWFLFRGRTLTLQDLDKHAK